MIESFYNDTFDKCTLNHFFVSPQIFESCRGRDMPHDGGIPKYFYFGKSLATFLSFQKQTTTNKTQTKQSKKRENTS